MPDYSKGKIYKICSDDPDITDVYIGSTVQGLSARFRCHINKYNKGNSSYSSRVLFANYGVDKFHIEQLEACNCESKKEMHVREQYHIDNYVCVNKKRAFTSEESQKEHLKLYRENYAIEHGDKIKARLEETRDIMNARARERYNANIEKGREKSKKQRKNNPEHCKARDKKYRELRGDILKEQKKKSRSSPEQKLKTQAYNKAYREAKKHATLMEALQQQAQACP
jgi:hypothetical protein